MKRDLYLIMGLFIVLLIIVVAYRYNQYVLNKNFLLEVNATCDKNIENCFLSDCEPDMGCDPTPYKKIEIQSNQSPWCMEEHTCPSFYCKDNNTCKVTYCSATSLEDGEKCLTE